MAELLKEVTFQVNLSPGDVTYAAASVPGLLSEHSGVTFSRRIAVVDCCRPAKTKGFDPDSRCPEPDFSRRAEKIVGIADRMMRDGLLDEVRVLRPGDPLIADLSAKYTRKLISATHEYGGTAFMSYLAGIELSVTRYVLHYDADMFLHQEAGYDWVPHAIRLMKEKESRVSASPSLSPPRPGTPAYGRMSKDGLITDRTPDGSENAWFSTRCFLLDKAKLERYMPILDFPLAAETLLRRLLGRSYPQPPEQIFFKRFRRAGAVRIYLPSDKGWLLHPNDKKDLFLELLPFIAESVRRGVVPDEQRGAENLDLAAWSRFRRP